MADRYWYQNIRNLLAGHLCLTGRFELNGAADPVGVEFKGVQSVRRNGIGVFQVTLLDRYPAIFGISSVVESPELSLAVYELHPGFFGWTGARGQITGGSPTVANVTVDTSSFSVGQEVVGRGIAAGSTIQAIPDSTTLTLSQNATNTLQTVFQVNNDVSGLPLALYFSGSYLTSDPPADPTLTARITFHATTARVDLDQ